MIYVLLIVFYLLSTIGAWSSIRNWNIKNNNSVAAIEIFFCLMPLFNFMAWLIFYTPGKSNIPNKFFNIK